MVIFIRQILLQVRECEWASSRIGEMISLYGESDQKINSFPYIPTEFFEDMETSWKGRIKRIHIDEEFVEVQKAAEALSLAVSLRHMLILFKTFALSFCTCCVMLQMQCNLVIYACPYDFVQISLCLI